MARKIGFGFLLIVALPILLWLVYMRPGPSSIYYPPYDLTAIATPFDTTGSITLNWFSLEGDDSTAAGFSTYRVLRSSNAEGPFEEIGVVGFDAPRTSQLARQFRDITVGAGFQYYYKISNEINGVTIESNVIGPLESAPVIPEEEQTAMQGEVVFPPSQLRVFDTPNDDGESITLEWKISPSDESGNPLFGGYDIYRSSNPDGPFEKVGETTGGLTDPHRKIKIIRDGKNIENKKDYYYYVSAKLNGQTANSDIAGPVEASQQWFNTARMVSLVLLGILLGSIFYFINQAKAGKTLFIRKIAGLEAVDEAVGRATEMGKSIFYIPGIQDMDNMQTIAGLTILGRVAKLTAEYETKLEVPVSRSLVMVTAREIVKESYLDAGRPDYFEDDMVFYLTDDQFGYAAGVDGLITRKKPATIFRLIQWNNSGVQLVLFSDRG